MHDLIHCGEQSHISPSYPSHLPPSHSSPIPPLTSNSHRLYHSSLLLLTLPPPPSSRCIQFRQGVYDPLGLVHPDSRSSSLFQVLHAAASLNVKHKFIASNQYIGKSRNICSGKCASSALCTVLSVMSEHPSLHPYTFFVCIVT